MPIMPIPSDLVFLVLSHVFFTPELLLFKADPTKTHKLYSYSFPAKKLGDSSPKWMFPIDSPLSNSKCVWDSNWARY